MSCPPTLTRLVELKNRLEDLKREAEAAVSNVKCIVARGNAVVAFQESIENAEQFLRSYPTAGTELDLLMNNLVKLNCELEIGLSRKSDTFDGFESNVLMLPEAISFCKQNQLCSPSPNDKRSVGTNTDEVWVTSIQEINVDNITEIFGVKNDSILEMKHLEGAGPSNFWLGYYSDSTMHSLIADIQEKINLGKLIRLKTSPSVGQYIIGYLDSVFRGCVLSVSGSTIAAVDIDTGTIKFLKESDAWQIGSELHVPPQALYCKLWNIPDNIEWCNFLRSIFRNFLSKCNLVVTVKDIVPGHIPTFIVDVDAHDNALLSVNISGWIQDHVLPAYENVKLYSLSSANEQYLLKDLDPCVIYREDSTDSGSVHFDETNEDSEHVKAETSEVVLVIQENSIGVTCGNEISQLSVQDECGEISANFGKIFTDSESIVDSHFNVEENVDSVGTNCENDSYYSVANSVSEERFDEMCGGGLAQLTGCNKSCTVQCTFEKGTKLEMTFSQGKDPWNFILSSVTNHEIEDLQKRIAASAEEGLLTYLVDVPDVGDFAIGKCDEKYFRVQVIGIVSQTTEENIIVIDVDSGDVKHVCLGDLWVLREEFSLPPAQAIKCSMWNIPRVPPYWNIGLEELFRKVMTQGLLTVHIKNSFYEFGSWKHWVEIKISAGYVFDVSEWIMVFVVPKLEEIKRICTRGYDITDIVSKLDPDALYGMGHNNVYGNSEHLNEKSFSTTSKTGTEVSSENDTEISKSRFPNRTHKTSLPCDGQALCMKMLSLRQSEGYKNEATASEFSIISNKDRILGFKKASFEIEPGTKYFAFLSIVASPSEFYVHIVSEENMAIDKMHEQLNDYCSLESVDYTNKGNAKQLISQCCAVFYGGQWCRGHVLDWLEDSCDEVLVYTVDYGIQTKVSYQLVQYLRSDFFEYPVFAQKCMLAFIKPPNNNTVWPEKSLEGFRNLLDFNAVYEICVERFIESDSKLNVFLLWGDGETEMCINDCLVDEGYADDEMGTNESKNFHSIVCPMFESGMNEVLIEEEDCWDYNLKNQTVESLNYFDNNTAGLPEIDEELSIILTHIINIRSFYGVITTCKRFEGNVSTHNILIKMNERIQNAVQCGQLKPSNYLTAGSIVIACYSADKRWYRARLLTPLGDDGTAEVFFVDYGNVDCVHKNYIRKIEKEFCTFPFQAMRFFIDDLNLTVMKVEQAQRKALSVLYKLQGKSDVQVKVVRRENEDIFVRVFNAGENIAAKMLHLYKAECIRL